MPEQPPPAAHTDEDVTGHAMRSGRFDAEGATEDDVEGRAYRSGRFDTDPLDEQDVEGHLVASKRFDPDVKDDDTSGHIYKSGGSHGDLARDEPDQRGA